MNQQPPIQDSIHCAARIETQNASRYLQQLCKHFAHKLPVEFNESAGHVVFPMGDCHLTARDGLLLIALAAEDEEKMTRLQDVVARHLARFAFRETFSINWRPDGLAAGK